MLCYADTLKIGTALQDRYKLACPQQSMKRYFDIDKIDDELFSCLRSFSTMSLKWVVRE